MNKKHTFQDPTFLAEQYRTQDNLQVRVQTHELYGQPKLDFQAWVLDQIDWQGTELVLDVGCGSGSYAAPAAARGRTYIAGDMSMGMLTGLPAAVSARLNLNAQQLPLADDSADVILANHMLYHVPDLARAVGELRRVLRPDGVLLAATNSQATMSELRALRQRVLAHFQMDDARYWQSTELGFSLESGAADLGGAFGTVSRIDLPGALVFPDPEPVIAYLLSGWARFAALLPADIGPADVIACLRDDLAAHIAEHGEFRVNKLTGVFVCRGTK